MPAPLPATDRHAHTTPSQVQSRVQHPTGPHCSRRLSDARQQLKTCSTCNHLQKNRRPGAVFKRAVLPRHRAAFDPCGRHHGAPAAESRPPCCQHMTGDPPPMFKEHMPRRRAQAPPNLGLARCVSTPPPATRVPGPSPACRCPDPAGRACPGRALDKAPRVCSACQPLSKALLPSSIPPASRPTSVAPPKAPGCTLPARCTQQPPLGPS